VSKENVEFVRKALDAFNAFMRGELSRDEVTNLGDPHFEFRWHDERTMPDLPQDLRGRDAFIEFWEQLGSAWDDLTVEALELIEAPHDRVLALTRQSGRGRESRVPVDVHSFQLWTIRDGRVRALELFRHRSDAVEAAGLSE
jgi:ketosteroid isomerase-like protein